MRRNKIAFGLVAALATGAALFAGFARAEDPAKGPMPPVQKEVKHPFFDSLLGSWTVETTGEMAGKGKATFAKGVGGTAILEEYESTSAMGPFYGHGIHKVSDDNKTVTVWWLDLYSAEPLKLSGPLKENGYEISGDVPGMGRMRITVEKKGEGMLFKMYMGDKESMSATYTKAK